MTLYKKKRRKLAVWLIVSASLALSSSAYPEQEDEPEMEATEVGVLWGEPELIDNTLHARAKTNKPPPDILRMKFPECSEECRPEMHGDGWCQDVCATVECGNDGKDCDGWCAPDCKPSWVGDGFCDNDCYVEACEFDKHDCDGRRTKVLPTLPPKPKRQPVADEDVDSTEGDLHDTEVPLPPEFQVGADCECDRSKLGNHKCDAECNTEACFFDMGDCKHMCSPTCHTPWLGDGDCDTLCFTESCGFDKGDCKECSKGCRPDRIGNGICDGDCMNNECHWDMGDCAGVCKVYPVQYDTDVFEYNFCRYEWLGDNACDCMCMNNECRHDHSDCDSEEDKARCSALIRKAEQRQGGVYPLARSLSANPFSGEL